MVLKGNVTTYWKSMSLLATFTMIQTRKMLRRKFVNWT